MKELYKRPLYRRSVEGAQRRSSIKELYTTKELYKGAV
jgi:hypothetical protein